MGDQLAVRAALDNDQLAAGDRRVVRLPLTSNGTIRSESPWMTRVGTSNFARSARKSVRPHAPMQSSVPFGEANGGDVAA